MIHARSVGTTLLLATLASGGVRADDAGFYLGAGIGQADQSSGEFDSRALSLRAFGGYSINQYLAAEGGYIDVAEQTDSVQSLDVAVKSEGFFVAGLVKVPVSSYFSPYAKVGYVFYDTKTTASSGLNSVSQSRNDDDLLYGVGFEFSNGRPFRFRLEYEKVDVADGDFRILSVSGLWQF